MPSLLDFLEMIAQKYFPNRQGNDHVHEFLRKSSLAPILLGFKRFSGLKHGLSRTKSVKRWIIIVPFLLISLDVRSDNVHDMEYERSYPRKENDNEHEIH